MTAVMTAVGIAVFFLGLLLSIAWHELGHLATAKMFNIRVTQYMVGFGKTLWSRKKGDTEYGVKLVPLGGFIRMVGMIPPAKKSAGEASAKKLSRWRAMVEDAREASYVEVEPGDEDRQFYQRAPWKRIIVMVAGPAMNFILAIVLFSIVLMGFGVLQSTTTVGAVLECVVPASSSTQTCPEDAEPTPAAQAGLRAGDTIVSVNGIETPTWHGLQEAIRHNIGPATIVVQRDGERRTLETEIMANQVAAQDEDNEVIYQKGPDGEPVENENGQLVPKTVEAGFVGFRPTQERTPLGPLESAERMGALTVQVGEAIVELPSKIPGVWGAAFTGDEREPDSPVGIVGASRIGGEILAMEAPLIGRISFFVTMLASVNLFLGAINLLPILPLDGGHIAGSLVEVLRRWWAKLFKRPDPGPFDAAQLMPIAYVVVIFFVGYSLLLLIADIVNPVTLTGG